MIINDCKLDKDDMEDEREHAQNESIKCRHRGSILEVTLQQDDSVVYLDFC